MPRSRTFARWPTGPAAGAVRVQRLAGRGGSATVYEARDLDLDRPVAIKVLDVPDRAGRAASRLAREALILARLDHPGIVPIHERGMLPDGRAFYVMKFVKGRPIDEAARSRPELIDRLDALRSRAGDRRVRARAGIVHRDLKPSNILRGRVRRGLRHGLGRGAVGPRPGRRAGDSGHAGVHGARAGRRRRGRRACRRLRARRRAADDDGRRRSTTRSCGHRGPGQRVVTRTPATPTWTRWPQTSIASAPASRRSRIASRSAERLLRVYRRYELPVLLVVAYILMRAALLLWQGI